MNELFDQGIARAKYVQGGAGGVDLKTVGENELTRIFKQAHDALWVGGKRNPAEAFDEFDLRSNLVVKQTKHLMSGNPFPQMQTEDIETLLIPEVDDLIQQRIIGKAEYWKAQTGRLRTQAQAELEAAKRRIEAMLPEGAR